MLVHIIKNLINDKVRLFTMALVVFCVIVRITLNNIMLSNILYDVCIATGLIFIYITCNINTKQLPYIFLGFMGVFLVLVALQNILPLKYNSWLCLIGIIMLLCIESIFFTYKLYKTISIRKNNTNTYSQIELITILTQVIIATYFAGIICCCLLSSFDIITSTSALLIILIIATTLLLLLIFMPTKDYKSNELCIEGVDIDNMLSGLYYEDVPNIPIEHKNLLERFKKYMIEKKPYICASCSIEDISKDLFTNKTYLSKVINLGSKYNFSQLMNWYRIHHTICSFIKSPNLKVNELYNISGFNNPTTFNLAFKLFLNKTPKEWCAEYRKYHCMS